LQNPAIKTAMPDKIAGFNTKTSYNAFGQVGYWIVLMFTTSALNARTVRQFLILVDTVPVADGTWEGVFV